MSHKLLILSSGGDAPGMNAAIRAVVRYGLHAGMEVYGCLQGFEGLIHQQIEPLEADAVANCIQRGGTILKTARSDTFRQPEVQARCIDYLVEQKFDSIVVLGGNGSFQGANKLAQGANLQVVGIPCTIDNDIPGTEYCIGFDTACNTALESIDRIRDTALSHDRNFIVEVMGRASGFLAVEVGIAGGAECIITPEFPISAEKIVDIIRRKKRKKLTSIIVCAEANQPGHSIRLAAEIQRISGLEYKTCILGHIQRGGTPSVKDRYIGTLMGSAALTAIQNGLSEKMTAVIDGDITLTSLPDATSNTQFFHREDLLKLNSIVCGIE